MTARQIAAAQEAGEKIGWGQLRFVALSGIAGFCIGYGFSEDLAWASLSAGAVMFSAFGFLLTCAAIAGYCAADD